MQVSLIPTEHVADVWPRLTAHIDKVAEYTYGRYDPEDVLESITQYDHNLWLAFEGEDIKGITITSFKQYPRIKCLDMVFCAGDEGMEWKAPMLEMLQHWAYDNECDRIESSGRLGWSKIFKGDGYKALWQTYELPVASSGLGA
jgi:hypothetical protein